MPKLKTYSILPMHDMNVIDDASAKALTQTDMIILILPRRQNTYCRDLVCVLTTNMWNRKFYTFLHFWWVDKSTWFTQS